MHMREAMHRTSMVWLVAAALVVGLAATSAKAAVTTVADLNDITLGSEVASATEDLTTVSLLGFGARNAGTVVSRVFEDNGLYTYTYEVTPSGMNHISHFNTGFEPLMFTGTAGWDFTQSANAGMGGVGAFTLVQDPDGTLDWSSVDEPSEWNSGETITFFYQSEWAPGPKDVLNIINGRSASGLGIVPIPEPASASLLGVLGLAMLRRRRRKA